LFKRLASRAVTKAKDSGFGPVESLPPVLRSSYARFNLVGINVVIGTITLALGGFVAALPETMPPERRVRYVQGYRLLGIALSCAGVLIALGGPPG
jgi:hypothetical protein